MYFYFVLIFSFLIRLIHLDQSLWLDEAVVAKVVKTIPFHLIPFQFSPSDFHPPLYYMIMSLWTGVFGYSEIALRFPSIIASLLAGWVVYKIILLIKDKKNALWGAAFFLLNPLIVYYSQEARMYMIATLFATCAFYYFLRLGKEKKQNVRTVLFFNIFCTLSILTFYGTLFFIGALCVAGFFVLSKKYGSKHLLVLLFSGIFLSLLLLAPLLLRQLGVAKVGLVEVKNWSLVLGKAEIKNVGMIFLKFVTGRLSWYPKWSYYLVAGISGGVVWLFVLRGVLKNKLLAFLFIFPLFASLLISFWAPMMQYFRFLYLIPVMSLLLSETVGRNKKYMGLFIIFLFIGFSLVYLLLPQFHREDWKSLSENISVCEPVFMILPSSDPLTYYNPATSLFELRNLSGSNVPETIQVVPYVEEIYGINHTELLNKKGCLKIETTVFRGPLPLEKWKCLKNS